MTVTASDLVGRQEAIASTSDLWEPPGIPLPHWGGAMTLSRAYRTVIQSSRSNAEQRFGLTRKPLRVMAFNLRSYKAAEAEIVRSLLNRMSSARIPMPLYPDGTRLTGRPDVSEDTYLGDFSHRRFQVGGRACIVKGHDRAVASGVDSEFVFRTITAVSDTEITLDGNLLEQYDEPPHYHDHFAISALVTEATDTFAGTTVVLRKGDVIACWIGGPSSGDATPTDFIVRDVNTGEEFDGVVVGGASTERTDSVFINTGMAYWVCTKSGTYVPEWTMTSDLIERIYFTQTSFTNVHPENPIHYAAFNNSAASSPWVSVGISLETLEDPSVLFSGAHQLAWTCFAAGVTNDPGFGVLQPTSIGTTETILDQDRAGSGHEYIAATAVIYGPLEEVFGSPYTQSMSLGFGGEDGTEGFHAGGIVLNPKESSGLTREFIFPVIECDLELSTTANAVTDYVSDAVVTLTETPGPSALDPLIEPGDTPLGYDEHDGYPILHLPIDWTQVQFGAFRPGERDRVGITNVAQTYGPYPGASFNLPFVTFTREDTFALMEFFDSRGGRLYPFWLFAPFHGTTAHDIPISTLIRFEYRIDDYDWDVYTHLGVYRKSTGDYSVHEITSAASSGGYVNIVLADALPTTTLSDLEVSIAHLVRFDTDEYTEEWITDEAHRTSLPVVQLLNEGVVEADLLPLCGDGSGGDEWEPNNTFDLCQDVRCGTDDPSGCCMCGMEGLVFESLCYAGECQPEVGCGNGCQLRGTCSAFLTYVSCTLGVMRWEHGDSDLWVELDTETKEWSHNFITSTFYDVDACCGDVDNGGTCFCDTTGVCDGYDPLVISESCSGYTLEAICNEYSDVNEGCIYVPTIRITPIGGGDGGPECA